MSAFESEHESAFESEHEISIQDTEWPVEATRDLVTKLIQFCSPNPSESFQRRQADPAAYAEKLTERLTCGTGMEILHEGFVSSLSTLLQAKGDLQSELAAMSQGSSRADADTKSLRFTQDAWRMRVTCARMISALSEALVDKQLTAFSLALRGVERELNIEFNGEYRFDQNKINSEDGAKFWIKAVQDCQALRSVCDSKVAAQEALLQALPPYKES